MYLKVQSWETYKLWRFLNILNIPEVSQNLVTAVTSALANSPVVCGLSTQLAQTGNDPCSAWEAPLHKIRTTSHRSCERRALGANLTSQAFEQKAPGSNLVCEKCCPLLVHDSSIKMLESSIKSSQWLLWCVSCHLLFVHEENEA